MICTLTRSLQPVRRVLLTPRISQFHSATTIRNAEKGIYHIYIFYIYIYIYFVFKTAPLTF